MNNLTPIWERVRCGVCGDGFSEESWDTRHTNPADNLGDVHERCCPCRDQSLEPLACPFCGDDDGLQTEFDGDDYFVCCFSCGAAGPRTDIPEEAIAKWDAAGRLEAADAS